MLEIIMGRMSSATRSSDINMKEWLSTIEGTGTFARGRRSSF